MARVFISHSSRDGDAAARIKVWLQEQGFETPFLDFDKHSGIAPGSDWEKTLYREIELSEAIIIVQTPNWLDSKWCFAEYTQARALGKAIFPVIEAPTGDTLIAPDIQALDLISDRAGGLERLARELTRIALDAQGGFQWDASRPPYPGLHTFQQEDAALYFGRDDDIRRLIERLNARRTQGRTKLIALLGASGSGKSSLLRAGVIPRLRRDTRNWIILPPMRPQAHPVDELARAITIALQQGASDRSDMPAAHATQTVLSDRQGGAPQPVLQLTATVGGVQFELALPSNPDHPVSVVGRGEDCDLVISQSSISRRHAEFRFNESGQLWVRDLASANGTMVNGQRVEQAPVQSGDTITLGDAEFQAVLRQGQAPRPAATEPPRSAPPRRAAQSGRNVDWRSWRDQLLGPDVARVLSDLASDLRIQADAPEAQILIPIDQGEELYGTSEPEEADRFFEILNTAMAENLPFLAILAQRSDYLEQLQSAEKLTVRFEEFSLPPLPLARIPQIIEGPARVAGLSIEEGLVLQASRDAETEDALPLLAFALRELYDRYGEDNHLSLNDYHALGDPREGLTPLENAVRKAADDVLDEAQPEEDQLVALRDAFVPAMAQVNDKGEYARRPARWDELPAKAHDLLERLAKARLLIISQEGDDRVVEVAHEALLRKWPRLRNWLDEARDFLVGKQQLERDLADWDRAAKADKPSALLTGLKLNRAQSWLLERPHQLTATERSFVQASIDLSEFEARRKLRMRRRVTRISVTAALVLACVAAFSGWQWLQLQETGRERAFELTRYAWVDLATKEQEVVRLTKLARQLNQRPDLLVYSVNCASEHCMETKKQPDGYDCKTSLDSGFRHLYCSVRSVINFDKVQSISGLRIFRAGSPHDDEFDLSSAKTFGHYNPAFLQWVDDYIIPQPGKQDPLRFNSLTRLVYNSRIGPLARALYHSHQILFASPEAYRKFEQRYQIVSADYREKLRRRETNMSRFDVNERAPKKFSAIKSAYEARIAKGAKDAGWELGEDFRWLSDYLATDKNDDWYLANTAGGFWVRRSIDGTEAQVFRLLTKLLQCFEPKVLGPGTPPSCPKPAAPALYKKVILEAGDWVAGQYQQARRALAEYTN